MSQNPPETTTPSDGDYVPPAFKMRVREEEETARVRCKDCRESTEHEWLSIIPYAIENDELFINHDQVKKILMCTQCGKVVAKR